VLRLHVLPAGPGDSIWVDYGDPMRPRRILVDGGTKETYAVLRDRIMKLPETRRHFELLVVTHIDSDHLGGALRLLDTESLGVTYGDIWFNGFRHLPGSEPEDPGPIKGESFTSVILRRELPWNTAFDGAAAMTPAGGPPTLELADGLRAVLLSPGAGQLEALRPVWQRECRRAGLDPLEPYPAPPVLAPPTIDLSGTPDVDALADTSYEEDDAEANGSSIAVLLEYEGRRLLLAGDAHASVLGEGISALLEPGERLALDAFLLPHHGCRANLSRELLQLVACRRFLFSTDGAFYSLPDAETVARTVKYGGKAPHLAFNYHTRQNEMWDDFNLMMRHDYTVAFPSEENVGIVLDL